MDTGNVQSKASMWSLRRESDQQRYALWDALADFGCHDLNGAALQLCMRQIASSISAEQAFWGATVRARHERNNGADPYKGWRLGAWVAMDHTSATSPDWMHTAAHVFNSSGAGALGAATRRVLEQTGQFRVFALSKGMVDLDSFQETRHYNYFIRQQGIVDRIWVVFPVNNDSESCFCFDRFEGQPVFDLREIKMAAEALRGIKWFHRQLLLCHGIGVAEQNLTPAECRTVRELLTGASEKAIAEHLNLTKASAHQYIRSVYRKFGVHGRSEFMSLWLT